MHLLLVAGFLGSGKTSLIIRLAEAVSRENLKTAILVNEIGQVGIDNQLMRQLELDVWELMGGCICCTLTAGLLSSLHKLDERYEPDLVILEATGAANPTDVLDALHYYRGRPLQSVRTAVVVDPLRLPKYMLVVGHLMRGQISPANVLIMTKTDVASDEEVVKCQQIVCGINPDAPLLRTSVSEQVTPALIQGVLPWLN